MRTISGGKERGNKRKRNRENILKMEKLNKCESRGKA